VPTLEELAVRAGGIDPVEVEHFHRLVAVWQLLSDLSFSDVLLLAPITDDPDGDLLVLAQIRPDTAQTLYQDDHVGTALLAENAPQALRALQTGKPQRGAGGDPRGSQRAAIPLRSPLGRVPGVLLREGMPFGGRRVSALEQAYVQCADALYRMTVEGVFPFPGMEEWETPRVSDGLIVLAPSGLIVFASPNAIAAHRRLGIYTDLTGSHIQDLVGGQALWSALDSGVPVETEVEVAGGVVNRRLVPFRIGGENTGGLVLARDVTEVRRRDRMLMYKDAVIREIHHRVKNNLQTIASLLRLQARRLGSEEGKAALEESVRRISTIAFVHETLSQASGELVDFGEVLRGILRMLEDALALDEQGIAIEVLGGVGDLPAVVATPLALVVTELVQNAAEHAFVGRRGGHVQVSLKLEDSALRAIVADDGRGLPKDFTWPGRGLGLQIVRALVEGELKGSIEIRLQDGTEIEVVIPLPGLVAL
jgi:hypothetical protein